jgi:hypothetical protein
MRLLYSSKPELQAAALHCIANVLLQPDEIFVQNDRVKTSSASSGNF